MNPTLSLVIPAFNEEKRLGPYLAEIRDHLDAAYPSSYEVLVVDDGSRDGTAGLVQRAAGVWSELRLLRHPANRGKGATVRTGVLASKGTRVLYADADGATPIGEEWKLSAAIDRGAVIAAGSRRVPGPGVKRDRNWRRALAGGLFAWAARTAVGVRVRDTQCGFKMLDGPAGRELFRIGRETGYLFDVELLALAGRFGYPIAEVPINWSERPGSKVRLVRDSLRMLRNLWYLRGRLRRGLL
ncbi:MAG TPA: dolichyl-phosphate beta-glucosyltransferase, partial [Gemmataceae bacterium]|nr:dolichyl-phosphate beta-glucosyltransferase [Gemmataceae bacterium]